jgi:hypothetical protein
MPRDACGAIDLDRHTGAPMISRRLHVPALAALVPLSVALILPATDVQATAFCNLKKTPDGFVALRAGPSPKAKLLHRMRPNDEVLPSSIEEKGAWVKVTYWRGGRFRISKEPAGDPPTATGWMNKAFLDEERCG